EKELKNIQELNKLYLNASSAFMIALDRDANITMINKTASEMLGFTEKEILGKNWFEIGVLPPLSIKEGKTIFSKFISGDCESDQQTHQGGILSKDGKSFVLTWSTSLLREDDEIVGVLGSALDTTELYNTQRELKKQTYIDALTNTYNRKYYNLKISESLSLYERNQTPFTVLMYDIDDFKKINDSYGHLAGDDILTEMSQLIQSNIRKSDYLFRVGGEEFVIIFADTHLKQAKIVAEKIRKSVEESLENLKNETITISIGVTQVQKSDNADDIYKRVDDLLYISKKNGKNMVSF
ncbi:MAG: sensor domain-containing diguanylate cyclase, partial [Campylobacterota bacterium]|nr:sensor domain-containing diguanylate cyclase [Campylobacterota bacterium]